MPRNSTKITPGKITEVGSQDSGLSSRAQHHARHCCAKNRSQKTENEAEQRDEEDS
jgi:hypothetical protein